MIEFGRPDANCSPPALRQPLVRNLTRHEQLITGCRLDTDHSPPFLPPISHLWQLATHQHLHTLQSLASCQQVILSYNATHPTALHPTPSSLVHCSPVYDTGKAKCLRSIALAELGRHSEALEVRNPVMRTMRHDAVQHDATRCGVVRCCTMRHDAVW